jgi:ATP-binding cassette subfamily B protein
MALLTQVVLSERDLRARSHGGTLVRYLLDALRGLTCIRAHGAEKALEREHEAVLVHWTEAQRRLQTGALAIEAGQSLVAVALSAWLVLGHVAKATDAGSVLLFAYWALLLPSLGSALALAARQVPGLRNVLLRLMEPLGAPEEEVVPEDLARFVASSPGAAPIDGDALATSVRPRGVRVEMRDVSVVAAGHTLLESIDLDIDASSHVAIVGLSGAGKSTLVSLLLGWHRPASGHVLVDGALLDPERIARLRRQTAWVDPAVRLFGRGLLDNLTFGAAADASPADVGGLIDAADLRDVVERLPEGLQTPLGEGGALVSGGEGQRVRLGRAMLRRDARLVILDEPFRGLDRERRGRLLTKARAYWQNATLVCITHDVGETRTFPRVLVVEGGRVVEDGDPNYLGADESSRYATLVAAEEQVRHALWSGVQWRRLRMDRGRLVEPSKLFAMSPVEPVHVRAREVVG